MVLCGSSPVTLPVASTMQSARGGGWFLTVWCYPTSGAHDVMGSYPLANSFSASLFVQGRGINKRHPGNELTTRIYMWSWKKAFGMQRRTKFILEKKGKNEPKSNFTKTSFFLQCWSSGHLSLCKDHLLNFIFVFNNKNNNFYEHEKYSCVCPFPVNISAALYERIVLEECTVGILCWYWTACFSNWRERTVAFVTARPILNVRKD